MAITGIDTIDGKQIIAAGAVSAKSAEMAYNDENGNPITGYLTAVPTGYATTGDLTAYQTTAGMTAYQSAGDYLTTADSGNFLTAVPDTYLQNTDLTITDGKISEISGVPLSAGSTPAYGYTDNGFISSIDTSGLYAVSAGTANAIINGGRLGTDVYAITGAGTNDMTLMILNPKTTPFGNTSGIYGPLYYAQGACMTYGSSAGNTQYFGGFFKGNEWYVSNATAGQALRGEVHKTRGVHISGATTAGYGFNLGIDSVSGMNSTGSWKYGPAEDAALRAVSSCNMHESAFEYDANDKISGYNGSAFAGGSDVPEGVMVESGIEYNAVNEISGYNGSAIAQYGAEKQWIVVDDTLLTLSNSAQFAIGVNISAVQQLMGIDETELLSSTATSAFILTEPLTGFKAVKIKLRWWDKVPDNYYDVERFTTGKLSLSWTYFDNITDGGPLELAGASWTSNNGIDYNLEGGFARTFGITSTGMGHFTLTPYPLSIVGVGRIN